jgi:hypothetical protein
MQRLTVPRRLRVSGVIVVAIAAVVSVFAIGGASSRAAGAASSEPLCVQHPQLCTERLDPSTYEGSQYTAGHDEPSVLFYSNKKGSGNSNRYQVTLPSDPAGPPSQDGSGATWNFQLRPAFWLGMTMCDDQSAPNPGVNCPADSDKNILTSEDPNSPDYFGLTPGQAFMEMQFYPPGWGPISCTDAEGNHDGKWCAALTIDSDPANMNTGEENNEACQDIVGPEPVNFAMITKSGHPVADASPDTGFGNQAIVTPDTLEFNNGDKLTVDMHDTKAGFQVVVHDLTTGESGLMTASVANGFGHALFQPNASSCTFVKYAFHPMFSTTSEDTRTLWAAHTYNVAFSDEIGHFEYCQTITNFACTQTAGVDQTPDDDDFPCFAAPIVGPTGTTLNPSFKGCVGSDDDYDGPSYVESDWPGGSGAAAGSVATAFQLTSPLFSSGKNGKGKLRNYDRVAFETDLPRIEGSDFSTTNDCQRHFSNPQDPSPGSGCVNPPNGPDGPAFYPLYTTANVGGTCVWHQGGANIPGTTNTFGGTSHNEYGGLLLSPYPAAGFTVTERYNNFHRTLRNNPCPA